MSTPPHTGNQIAAVAARWVSRRDAGLSTAERAELARWCAADPRHACAFEHYANTWSALDRPRQADAILQALRGRVRRRRQQMLAVAATVLLTATAMWRWQQPTAASSGVAVHASGILHAPETRTLSDGSIVELNHGAEIAVDFTPAVRRVELLRGEAHFQVAKNKERPFVVVAGGMQVRAVGTAFSVQRAAEQIEVLVTEGRIAVEKPEIAPDAGSEGPTGSPVAAQTLATVSAGERVVVSAALPAPALPEVIAISAEEAAARLTWREPRVEFSETPLAEAVAMMNRSSRGARRLELAIDPTAKTLAREPVSGVFRVDNTEAFVRVLELSLGVQTERQANRLVMRRGD